jgi:hypothetical protein
MYLFEFLIGLLKTCLLTAFLVLVCTVVAVLFWYGLNYVDNYYTIQAYNTYCTPDLNITAFDSMFLDFDLDIDVKNCKLFN